MLDEVSTKTVLSENGLLQKNLSDAKFRPSQLQMAEAIEQAMSENSKLIVEAATGTGKTFAYLIPAILSGKTVVISTGTKNLQDQLFKKDIPTLAHLLKRPIKAALLKGRGNYLCKHRIDLHQTDNHFYSRHTVSELYKVKLWQNQTKQGDKAEIDFIQESSEVWPLVTSTKDNCIGQDCDFFKKCFVMQARRKAIEADIIVINHHLFFADLMIKEGGFGELLPEVDVIIFDEAHQLPDIASVFLGQSLSSRRILELSKDVIAEILKEASANREIITVAEALQKALADMRISFGIEMVKKPWQQICYKQDLINSIKAVKDDLNNLRKKLEVISQVSKGLEACYERTIEIETLFNKVTEQTGAEMIHWYETYPKSFVIHLTPLDIAPEMEKLLTPDITWIFTSATIAVKNNFDFYKQRMGLKNAETLQIQSHYDFVKQAKLYLPQGLPLPNDGNYIEKLIEKALPIIDSYQGKTFFLFTSFSALYQAKEILENIIPYPLLIQGQKPKATLLKEFVALGNAVLLGTNSFWEGVDVKGDALSCVIIDKLPFAAPNDPVLQARINAMRQKGLDPFHEHQLPQAVIALKQGVGRLIRDENDHGTIILGDPRLKSKPYGKIFLDSLPEMTTI